MPDSHTSPTSWGTCPQNKSDLKSEIHKIKRKKEAIKEVQIKIVIWYHFTPMRLAIMKKTDENKGWLWRKWNSLVHCWREWKIVLPLWKTVSQFLKQLNIELLYDPAVPFLAIYPRKLKIYLYTKAYTQMFLAVFIHDSQKVETTQMCAR